MLLIDASIACKWYLDEAGSDMARRILAGGEELAAPEIILAEVGNALWRCHGRGEITVDDAGIALRDLEFAFHSLIPTGPLLSAAFSLATRLRHPIYDCFYLAAAFERGVPMVTADARLMGAVRGTEWEGSVRLLG